MIMGNVNQSSSNKGYLIRLAGPTLYANFPLWWFKIFFYIEVLRRASVKTKTKAKPPKPIEVACSSESGEMLFP